MKSLIPHKTPAAAIFKSAAALALVAGNLSAEPIKSDLLNERIVKAAEIYATAHPEVTRFIADAEGLKYRQLADPSGCGYILGTQFTGETNRVVLNEKVVEAFQMYATAHPESAVFITDTVTGLSTKSLIDPSTGKAIGIQFIEAPAR